MPDDDRRSRSRDYDRRDRDRDSYYRDRDRDRDHDRRRRFDEDDYDRRRRSSSRRSRSRSRSRSPVRRSSRRSPSPTRDTRSSSPAAQSSAQANTPTTSTATTTPMNAMGMGMGMGMPMMGGVPVFNPQLMAQSQMMQQQALQATVTGEKKQREVYVGNLLMGVVNELMLRELFNGAFKVVVPDDPLPVVVSINMGSDGRFAFVELRLPELADAAMHLDKFDLFGRPMHVGRPKGYIPPAGQATPTQ
eukprot:m.8484 g.8484  ORF g.8484 m.8484 type:complete len:247 (+) comp5359_c0_seq1:69-809(+)